MMVVKLPSQRAGGGKELSLFSSSPGFPRSTFLSRCLHWVGLWGHHHAACFLEWRSLPARAVMPRSLCCISSVFRGSCSRKSLPVVFGYLDDLLMHSTSPRLWSGPAAPGGQLKAVCSLGDSLNHKEVYEGPSASAKPPSKPSAHFLWMSESPAGLVKVPAAGPQAQSF